MRCGNNSAGGTRNGMVVHWPKGIKAKGELRSQWHHVIDIAPTILEAAGLPEPKSVHGTPQTPIEGVSMVYTFADPKAPSRHTTQYFEIFGNRAIYNDGWLAGTVHRAPWESKPRTLLENDKWELYDTRSDFSLTSNLAATNPEKLKQMQEQARTLEERISQLEASIQRAETKLSEFVSADESVRLSKELELNRNELETTMAQWEQVTQEIEATA